MCGFIALFSAVGPWDENTLFKGSESMSSRGPDGSGEWWSENRYIGLAHRRLSVIDVNHRSDQPMVSKSGRYVIAFNGEIYNYKILRGELLCQGVVLKTTSDTEVVLELFRLYKKDCLKKMRGMFAFVIWDIISEELFVARDPYGIKPLYFSKVDNGLIVASQVKAILATEMTSKESCPHGQGGYWLLGSVPEPYTWFRDIKAVSSGNYMQINQYGIKDESWHSIANSWKKNQKPLDEAAFEKRVQSFLYLSIKEHLVSDVPIGIFLSGGIDSTSLMAMMHDMGVKNIIGITLKYDEFKGNDNDESVIASYIAEKYNVQHHVRLVNKSEFREDLPSILASIDQPSVDGVNTWYASKCASELGLKVVISGVGGDELFQGYGSFDRLPTLVRFWRLASKVPGVEIFVKYIMKKKSSRSKNLRWNLFPHLAKSIQGAWFLQRSIFSPEELKGLMGKKLSDEFLKDFDPVSMVEKMAGKLPKNMKLALGQIESTCYLRNQLLRDSDWAGMHHGVEIRTPLVDSLLLENLSSDIPNFYRYPNKSILSRAPKIPLDKIITQKKKTGFSIPINQWLEDLCPEYRDVGKSKIWACKVASETYQDDN